MEPLSICQVEIRTRNLERALDFYGQVFDWQLHQVSAEYAFIDTGAPPLGALMLAPPSFPLGVCHYALVDDCDASGRQAVELGGHLCVDASDVSDSGRYVDTLDPWSNEIGFWQPRVRRQPRLEGSGANPFCWLELYVADLPAALRYYERLLGWRFEVDEGGEGAEGYAFTRDGGLARGVGLVVTDEATRGHRAMSYVETHDFVGTITRITRAGGEVVKKPTPIPGEGIFFVFRDPEGNRFGCFQGALGG